MLVRFVANEQSDPRIGVRNFRHLLGDAKVSDSMLIRVQVELESVCVLDNLTKITRVLLSSDGVLIAQI